MSTPQPLRVLIAGGGPAALEAMLALHRHAGDRVAVTLLAPGPDFVDRPMSVRDPFGHGAAERIPLAHLARAAGAQHVQGFVDAIDPDAHEVGTTDGATIAYDVLLIAVGAIPRNPFPHALAFGGPGTAERMHGLIQDVEGGYMRGIAFVVPAGASWPLPLYELAIMTAQRAWEVGADVELTLVTPEESPLEVFGPNASQDVDGLLADAGVRIRTATYADVPRQGVVELRPGSQRLTVNRVVTLPLLEGPRLAGLPHDADGFLSVDRDGRLRGVEDVYAAGDATDFPIKQGGLACQQADAAAEAIAARAGAAVEPRPFSPVLRGALLTERQGRFLRRDVSGTAGDESTAAGHALWWPPTKIAGRELARHLTGVERDRRMPTAADVEVLLPVTGG